MFNGNNMSTKPYSQVPLDEFSDDSSNGGDDFVTRSIQNQKLQMQKQDQGLEMLSQSAIRLGEMSMNIHDELNQQNQMLDEMDNDLETAGENLDMITRKTKELIEKSGGKGNCMLILCLTLTAVVLFLLILYT
ncbi:t_SNARE [Seminavis robusta]|uniref:T_SNARE n=1 Tax=Seminavis robusta TaxID=568900 RepID=A0A9N8DKF2_9STRA|nr:t_SNARE [Seminavis robusta]|eukprot:Sro190_g081960.1 t_SNARE (133) ;mRNA; f:75631-76151